MAATIGLTREAWGPRFWKVLHTLAETTGNQTQLILSNDEADAWILLIKLQQFVMPCLLCKEHYKQWRMNHRVDHLRKLGGTERKEFLREWLWKCHNRVNALSGKDEFPLEDIPTFYPKTSIQKELDELGSMFQLAITQRQLNYEDVKMWKNVIHRLRILVGI